MINQLFNKITEALDPKTSEIVSRDDIERVTAMLLVEIARADHDIGAQEREAIKHAVSEASDLSETELDRLIDDALQDADHAVSLHEHISLINERFNKANKIALVEQMWSVALADGNIDQYEDYTIRKLCDLLYIKHRDFMQAKLKMIGQGDPSS